MNCGVFYVVEKMERETRIELATNSLEGCDSTIELLPLIDVSLILESASSPGQPFLALTVLPFMVRLG